jgi:hypothetical protein
MLGFRPDRPDNVAVLTAVKDKPQGWPLKAASPTR